MAIEIVTAQLAAASGDSAWALRGLASASRETAQLGLVLWNAEARLAAGEIALAAGDRLAPARLETLAQESDRRGLKLVATKARAAARTVPKE